MGIARIAFAACGLLVVDWACAAPEPALSPGISDGPLPVDGPATSRTEERRVWEHHHRMKDFESLRPAFLSRGHGVGDWQAVVQGSEGVSDGLKALVQPGDRMPVGTVLVQSHRHLEGAELGMFVMEKKARGYFPDGGDWQYTVVRSDGRIEMDGKLEACARCHAEAEVDFVFNRVDK